MNNNQRFLKDSYQMVSHHSQIGGIEVSELIGGPAAGTKVAWVDTGSGLRFQVLIDRGMDISKAFYQQYSLAWLSHNGVMHPSGNADEGTNWLKYFAGGMMTTCGLDHTGPPETTNDNSLGLHGRISNLKAEIISIKQPDLLEKDYSYSITGKIMQSRVFGPHLEMVRTISGQIGSSTIKVSDKITNRGNTPAPHMQLYHINFGYPLLDKGSTVFWKGKVVESKGEVVGNKGNQVECIGPTEDHRNGKEGVLFIKPEPFGKKNESICGILNHRLNIAVTIEYDTKSLPNMTLWQHFGVREYVCAVEPCTNHPIGQKKADQQNELRYLAPGEAVNHSLRLTALSEKNDIDKLRNEIIK